ncbi:MAG: HlyD family efflux transporter periplasmic adaptor subunit [Caulobacteraceae bacterium]|nr:HlyD family efflux transporter periplasmic adaptor subunit [Caulobacteraceae bacterium]
MNRAARVAVAGIAVALVAWVAWRAWGPRSDDADVLSGYVEGETLYLSSPTAGPVGEVSVARGQRVAAGAPLFAMDPAAADADLARGAAAVAQAEAQARDARKGQRPAEQAVFDAQAASAQAQLREARADLDRVRPLVARGIYAPARLDQARATYDAAVAAVSTVERQKRVGALGARADAVAAADAAAAQARGALAGSDVQRARLAPTAPAAGRIQDVFFQKGEWAGANQPVVALIPDGRVRIRFFAPEAEVAAYRPGETVRFSCDGCKAGLSARINYVSPQPEFTPPVIYSRKSRDRLVFLIEALPDDPRGLAPGQPVDVAPIGGRR